MTDFNDYLPVPDMHTLAQWLDDTQQNTLCLMDDLSQSMYAVSQHARVNLPLWELGHVAWFHELWLHRHGVQTEPSLLENADRLYDSSAIAHSTRWGLCLPDIATTRAYLVDVHAKTQALLAAPLSAEQSYFIQLSVFHQDMHNEAFCYTRQSLGYALPDKFRQRLATKRLRANQLNHSLAMNGDLHFDCCSIELGAQPGEGFFFDNEKGSQRVELEAFSISPRMVSNQEVISFIDQSGTTLRPEYWELRSQGWFERQFDGWFAVDPQAIAMHLSYDLVQDYCSWANRRLPTEAEWQYLSVSPQWRAGSVAHSYAWEWTSSTFLPYAGFSADPYRDYSAPWFDGTYQVLRGASWVTPERLRRSGYRNFYQKNRSDIFCGFRTCAK